MLLSLISLKNFSPYFGNYLLIDSEIKKISDDENFDIYFLCKPDIPWEEDPLRENPNKRDFLFDKFKEKLSSRKKKYYEVYGRLDNRLSFCLDIISRIK